MCSLREFEEVEEAGAEEKETEEGEEAIEETKTASPGSSSGENAPPLTSPSFPQLEQLDSEEDQAPIKKRKNSSSSLNSSSGMSVVNGNETSRIKIRNKTKKLQKSQHETLLA